jgi:hypothetical protein
VAEAHLGLPSLARLLKVVTAFMLYASQFEPDQDRFAEFLACLWQGDVPGDLTLHRWLYLEREPRAMLLLWEAEGPGRAWVERAFGSFGTLTTDAVTDATAGLAACLDRDLDGFGAWMSGRGVSEEELAAQLDVRRRGLEAPSPDAAAAAGRAWAAERSS